MSCFLWVIVLPTQSGYLIGFGHYSSRALDVFATQLHALPIAGVLDPAVQSERLPIDGQQVVAAIAAREANVQMIEALLSAQFTFWQWQLDLIVR